MKKEARKNSMKITPSPDTAYKSDTSDPSEKIQNSQVLREIRLKYGASSKEYQQAMIDVQSGVSIVGTKVADEKMGVVST